MTKPESRPHDTRGPRNAILTALKATFPVFRDSRPLTIGIHKMVRERLPDVDPRKLRLAMRMHTASTSYLKSLSNGSARFDLDGNTAGELTPEHRKLALDDLRDRFRKLAEQRRAEQQALEKQEKLVKLAEKFNAR